MPSMQELPHDQPPPSVRDLISQLPYQGSIGDEELAVLKKWGHEDFIQTYLGDDERASMANSILSERLELANQRDKEIIADIYNVEPCFDFTHFSFTNLPSVQQVMHAYADTDPSEITTDQEAADRLFGHIVTSCAAVMADIGEKTQIGATRDSDYFAIHVLHGIVTQEAILNLHECGILSDTDCAGIWGYEPSGDDGLTPLEGQTYTHFITAREAMAEGKAATTPEAQQQCYINAIMHICDTEHTLHAFRSGNLSNMLGVCLSHIGNLPEASRAFYEATQRNPECAAYIFNHAISLFDLGSTIESAGQALVLCRELCEKNHAKLADEYPEQFAQLLKCLDASQHPAATANP